MSPAIRPGEIHAWFASVAGTPLPEQLILLSQEEQQRALHFRFDVHRDRFIKAHAILRILLGGYLDCPPASLVFEIEKNGKPRLPSCALHFNLAHSEDRALIAVTRAGPLGADLEHIRPMPDALQIARRFFSASESAALESLPAADRTRAFFRCWTRKEAFVKAIGEGLSHPLDSFSVSLGHDARLRSLAGDPEASACWTLEHLEPESEYVGAIAISVTSTGVRLFSYESDWAAAP